jgi:hypothetical protein
MKIVAVAGQRKDRETQSARIVAALAEQFDRSYDLDRHVTSLPPDANLYIQYGFKDNGAFVAAREKGIPTICLDRGYFMDRGQRFSVSINGFHGLSMQVPEVLDLPPREHPKISPMIMPPGKFVYLYGQMQGDRALRGLVVESWLRREAQAASEALKRPCKIRPHPMTISSWEPPLPQLHTTFEDAFVGVFYTSTATVQAVLAGLPCISMHPANPAHPVCLHSYDEFIASELPEARRQQWVHDLSHRNYDFNSFRQAAQYIRLGYPQAAVEALAEVYDTEGLRP